MPMICDPKIEKSGRDRQLDYEKCFRYWLELGSVNKVRQAFEREGILLEKADGTKVPFSWWGIWRGAWHWVIWHPEESMKVWQSFGYFMNGRDEEWKEWILKKIRKHADSPRLFKRALKVNGIEDWYNEKYAQK